MTGLKEANQKPWVTCPGPKCSLSQNPLLPRAAAVGGSAVGPRHCCQRKLDRVITFLLPSCFLTLSGFRFNPLGGPAPAAPHGVRQRLFLGGWGPAAPPLGSPSESLIEGGVTSTIPLKQNHIPALIVSTPGFGLAPCRGRHGERQDSLESVPVMGEDPYLPL